MKISLLNRINCTALVLVGLGNMAALSASPDKSINFKTNQEQPAGKKKPKAVATTEKKVTANYASYVNDTVGCHAFVSELMKQMTLEEKIGQLNLPTVGFDVTGPVLSQDVESKIRKGLVGGVFNTFTPIAVKKLQDMAVQETRLKIPLIFGFDVIHGHRTVFPIPLALASTWNMDLIQKSAHVAALEATADGLQWTFSPMVDIARDPRWGRVSEGAGEDPMLGSEIGKAMIKGYQGSTLRNNQNILACVKHFALYGAPEAGRDYNSVDMSGYRMYNEYLPPYKATIDAGVGTVMSSFNDINGVPATCNREILTNLLRDKWKFNGMVVTDYTAIAELMQHGMGDGAMVAKRSLNAGSDMDMVSELYLTQLPKMVADGTVPVAEVDLACYRILSTKYKLGLFTDPYRGIDMNAPAKWHLTPENRAAAKQAAMESFVLLQNNPENANVVKPSSQSANAPGLLPLKPTQKIAWIGPGIKDQRNLIGNWSGAGDYKQAVTLWDALTKQNLATPSQYALGCNFLTDTLLIKKLNEHGGMINYESDQTINYIKGAVQLALQSEVCVIYVGETFGMSGEAASRSNIQLPANQKALIRAIAATGKPIVLMVMNGRPLDLSEEAELVNSILITWFPGTEAGNAITDVLFGKHNPSGKLTMTFPRSVGQVPIYYSSKNTGRPFDDKQKYTSKYLDVANSPLFPFGHGLNYSNTQIVEAKPFNVIPAKTTLTAAEYELMKHGGEKDTVTATLRTDSIYFMVKLHNPSNMDAAEIVQLYTHQQVASYTRPVKELKQFQKVTLKAGETKEILIGIPVKSLSYFLESGKSIIEPGMFDVWIGNSSSYGIHKYIRLNP